MESQGGTGFRGALARLRHAPLWVWLTVLLTFGLLVFAYLQYRKSQANSATGASSAALGTVPGGGAGQPLWNTADTSGMLSGNMTDLQALLAYLQSQQTPNPSPTATPTSPGTTPQGTTVTQLKLTAPASLQSIANQYAGGNLAWLKSWNAQLGSQPGYAKPWWTLPAGTVVNIPHGASQPAA